MAEKKGLFGRLFGKKKRPDEPEIEPSEEEDLPSPPPDADDDVDLSVTDDGTVTDDAPAPIDTPRLDDPSEDETPEEIDRPGPVDAPDVPTAPQIAGDVPAPDPVDAPTPDPIAALAPDPAPAAVEPTPQDPEPDLPDAVEEKPKKKGLFGRLVSGLAKTSNKLTGGLTTIFRKRKLDDDTLEELEDLLISADLGLPTTTRIITTLSKTKYDQEVTDEEIRAVLAEEIANTLKPLEEPIEIDPNHRPHIILMTGVNGAGKTTTIGKLAKKFSDEGLSVLLAAGDTFRAAAIDQLKVWGERTGSPVVARDQGADAAGLVFDAIAEAREKDIDVVLIDTAGRLQNKTELMDELAKVVRVIKKQSPDAPHHTILTLDATVGQNALSQAQTFTEIAGVSGLVMTKLDGTARGGVLVALGDKFGLPIHYIGVGEAVEDLQAFEADDFARALTEPEKDA